MHIYNLCLVVGMVALLTVVAAKDEPKGFLMYKQGGGSSFFGSRSWKKRFLFLSSDHLEYHASKTYKKNKAKGKILAENITGKIETGTQFDWFTTSPIVKKRKINFPVGMQINTHDREYHFIFTKAVLADVTAELKKTGFIKEQEHSFSAESNKLKFTPDMTTDTKEIFSKFRKHKGNDVCADCTTKNPSWAILGLGVLVCDQCSVIYRSLDGDSCFNNKKIFIQNIRLDATLHTLNKNWLKDLRGNASVNKDLEYIFKGRAADYKPDEKASTKKRTEWIKAKYSLQYTKSHAAGRRRLATPIQRLDELIKSL